MKTVFRFTFLIGAFLLVCAFISKSSMYVEPVYKPVFYPMTWNDFYVKGKVAKVTETKYESYPIGTELVLRSEFEYSFDKEGFLKLNNQTKGILQGNKYLYHYNGTKRLMLVEQYTRYDKDTASEKWEYIYDEDSLLKEVKFYMKGYSWNQRTLYSYKCNKSGQKVSQTVTGEKGKFEEKTTYEYDKRGNLVSLTEYKEPDKAYYTKTYVLNKSNWILSDCAVYNSGSVYKTEYKYDKAGNRIESSANSVYKGKPETELIKWKYVFDSKGNWIEKNETTNGLISKKFIRVIEYF